MRYDLLALNARPARDRDGRPYPDKRRIVQSHTGARLVVTEKAVRRWKNQTRKVCR